MAVAAVVSSAGRPSHRCLSYSRTRPATVCLKAASVAASSRRSDIAAEIKLTIGGQSLSDCNLAM